MIKEDKQAVIQELQKEIYSDYIRAKAVYEFLTTYYAKDLAEDEDKIRQKLKDVRNSAEEESEKEKKDKENLKEFAIKINDLEGRIDFVVKKKDEVEKAKFKVNEMIDYYNILDNKDNIIELKKIK